MNITLTYKKAKDIIGSITHSRTSALHVEVL